MRLAAALLAVLLTASPIVRAAVIPDAPEPCPMAASMATDAPCLMAPCPCDHSSQGAVPPTVAPAVVEARCVVTRTHQPCVTARGPSPAVSPGHPFPIDRPPSRHA